MFHGRIPRDIHRDQRYGSSSLEEKVENIMQSVNYIQEQSDQAISLGDSANRSIREIMSRIEAVDSKVRVLESSNIVNTLATTPTRSHSRLPREVSVNHDQVVIN